MEIKGSRFDEVAVLKNVCWFEVRGEFSGHLRRGSYTVSFRLRYLDQADEGEEDSEDEEENNEDVDDQADEGEEDSEDEEENNEDVNEDSEPEDNNQALRWIRPVWNDRHWRPREWSFGWEARPVIFTLSTGKDHFKQESSRFLTAPHKLQDREIQAGVHNLASARPVEHGWMECDAGNFFVEDEDCAVSLEFSLTEIKGGNWKSGIAVDGVVIKPTFLVTS